MIGVKTVGSATLIAYDVKCILVTDPWMGEEDHAYFGSWNLPYNIPAAEKKEIYSTEYVWFSHGHPDHLNPYSVNRFKGKKILLPDHVGGRIARGFIEKGFDVEILPDKTWVRLSNNIRIFCITTIIQDAVLLVEINDHLFVDINDSGAKGCRKLIRKIARAYKHTYMLKYSGYSEADMFNFYDEEGNFIEPLLFTYKSNLKSGDHLSREAKSMGLSNVIPFSSFHHYQREDSAWANAYSHSIENISTGFHSDLNFISPFAIINCVTGEISNLEVKKNVLKLKPAEFYGDNWSEELSKEDVKKIHTYFKKRERINKFISFINFRVGGKDNIIKLQGEKIKELHLKCREVASWQR